ncbi:MAG: patatin-like phospholipase [Homavirus sp.]|uniref:Patatin-like phospholipase n=1 Tax=Homavirus sp. TaxID=2487769 RepID=A0A3G5A8C4_9VIRU|nr:MAG: patatin-like phospholipase [Homavirus sp.]
MGCFFSHYRHTDVTPTTTIATATTTATTTADTATIQTLTEQVNYQQKIIQDQLCLIDTLKNKYNTLNQKNNNNTQTDNSGDILNAKANKDYEYIVLSGGGIKGVSYCGALEVLDKYNIIYDKDGKLKIKGFAGTSAGSITASLLAVGMKVDDLKTLITGIDFDKFLDDKVSYIRDGINFIKHYGLCPGEYVQNLIADQVEKITGNRDYTIQQLYDDKGVTLVIVSTDMNNQKSIYMYPNNPNTLYSQIPIHMAVRMSMSIPFLFMPVLYDNNYHVDGGVLDNYAIHVFDGAYPGDPNARLNICAPNPKVLGLQIITTDDVMGYKVVNRQPINGIIQYSISFIDTFMTENDRRVMSSDNYLRTIFIVTANYPLTTFSLTDQQRQDLISAGTKYTDAYFTDE